MQATKVSRARIHGGHFPPRKWGRRPRIQAGDAAASARLPATVPTDHAESKCRPEVSAPMPGGALLCCRQASAAS